MRGLPAAYARDVDGAADLESALARLGRFYDRGSLTSTIAGLEHALDGCSSAEIDTVVAEAGISPELLLAAVAVRDRIGRVNDVIHAVAIALALPRILKQGERLRRPSLAAGNDRSRPFDLETDLRVAEFKLARWDGHDAMRKRQTFKDFVDLAAEESSRSAELYVVGERPIRFLRTSRSSASWGLDRAPATRERFEQTFGSLDQSISSFVNGRGRHVTLTNLEALLPDVFGSGDRATESSGDRM